MAIHLRNWSFFSVLLILCSCQTESPKTTTRDNDIIIKIDKLQEIQLNPENRDSILREWQNLLSDKTVNENDLYLAKVNYQLARFYGMVKQNESASRYLKTAFNLIELQPGNLDEKARIYQGIGNISWANGELHEANYYYNKAAAIVLADTTTSLPDAAKISILLAAAQSNQQFQRYELAGEMNEKALVLSQTLPEGHINRQRPITQIIQTLYNRQKNLDSIGYYVGLLEEMNQAFPYTYDPYHLYQSKTLYFNIKDQKDSMLKYHKLSVALLEQNVPEKNQSNVGLNNLFASYVNVAGLLVEKKQLSEAAAYLSKSAKLTQDFPDKIDYDNLLLYHKCSEKYHLEKGDIRNALVAADAIADIQEVLFRKQNTQAIAEMNSLYEIQAQERSIKNLNENVKIKELQLRQNKLWLTVSLLGALVLVLLLFFLYYGFRQRRIRQEKDAVILQQQLLRTQMEPHFIFNTLTALQSYIRRGASKEAITYLGRFSKLLRSSLELSREKFVPIDHEIEALENYLYLQQMRFDNAFTYNISVSDYLDAEGIHIPPMLIQPFVENAILHGVDMKGGNGFIHIDISEDKDLLKLEITDSGRTGNAMKTSNNHRSLSGIISRERLALLGKNARMETTRNESGGTKVTLYLPMQYKSETP